MKWGEFNWIESSWMNWMRENEANNSVDKLLLDRRHRFAVSKDSPISVDLQLFRILLLAIAVSNVARILYHFQDFSEFFEIFSIFLMERNFWNFSGFWDSGILWGFFEDSFSRSSQSIILGRLLITKGNKVMMVEMIPSPPKTKWQSIAQSAASKWQIPFLSLQIATCRHFQFIQSVS